MKTFKWWMVWVVILFTLPAVSETDFDSDDELLTVAEAAETLREISVELEQLDPQNVRRHNVLLCASGCTLRSMGCMMSIGSVCGLFDRSCRSQERGFCQAELRECRRNCSR